jgi:hypothetical protein
VTATTRPVPRAEARLNVVHATWLTVDGRYRCALCGWRGDLAGAVAHVVARQWAASPPTQGDPP